MKRETIEKILCLNLRKWVQGLDLDELEMLQEIRMRVGKPLIVCKDSREFFLAADGLLVTDPQKAYVVVEKDMKESLEFISDYSMYAYEDDLRNGYITVEGGHRIGLSGKVVVEKGMVKTIKNISCINIRISHQIKGCGNSVVPYLYKKKSIYHTLIISPPRCGKTTLLRDIIRQISDGNSLRKGLTIGVVDERSEIGGCYRGIPQNDIGIRTDILDGCPKTEGMLMLIRSMSPKIIAVDEIGSKQDVEAIDYVINAGCKLICTVHGDSFKALQQKPVLQELMDKKVFERFVVLENKNSIGDVKRIYDVEGKLVSMVLDK